MLAYVQISEPFPMPSLSRSLPAMAAAMLHWLVVGGNNFVTMVLSWSPAVVHVYIAMGVIVVCVCYI